MFRGLLPEPVAVVETAQDVADPGLFPEEAERIAAAVDERRREFGTVRYCARSALAGLGGPRVPLLPGERGAPRWPDGFVGTMTHCRGYRAAAVARAADMDGVGMDVEPNEPLRDSGVLNLIALPEERAALPGLAARRPDVAWDRLIFSAKESVYKVWFPLTRKWLDFEEAVIEPDPDAGTFRARLLVPGPVVNGVRLGGFTGRWDVRDGLVGTAIGLVRERAAGPAAGPAAAPDGPDGGRGSVTGAVPS
ncbi:4'-phosphopantetheinyl transferase family protein [Streptomyces marincola]|uniref:4'-phosphopantetheinyl transferase family protein n=1 Tax=Streptomyces marincola TaxID=2878388 RepID=UPI001CF3DA47|nr:4'-phosphopantetheinyl transferase superfamily protein [Streptomyces marincola]UCM91808.1 4'-phosphopantetheinyl transferase superfamily protein [Streptomyces marincola]